MSCSFFRPPTHSLAKNTGGGGRHIMRYMRIRLDGTAKPSTINTYAKSPCKPSAINTYKNTRLKVEQNQHLQKKGGVGGGNHSINTDHPQEGLRQAKPALEGKSPESPGKGALGEAPARPVKTVGARAVRPSSVVSPARGAHAVRKSGYHESDTAYPRQPWLPVQFLTGCGPSFLTGCGMRST